MNEAKKNDDLNYMRQQKTASESSPILFPFHQLKHTGEWQFRNHHRRNQIVVWKKYHSNCDILRDSSVDLYMQKVLSLLWQAREYITYCSTQPPLR